MPNATRLPSSGRGRMQAALLIVFFIAWGLLVWNIPPSEMVAGLGERNGYLTALLAGFIGGFSLFITAPTSLAVATLAAGGLNPYLLGTLAGAGVFLGDSTSYLVGRKGLVLLPPRIRAAFEALCAWCVKRPPWAVFLLLFLYGAAVPLPNDVIVVTLGLAGYSYWKLMIPLGLGSIVLNIIYALIGAAAA